MGNGATRSLTQASPHIPIANVYYLYCYAWERFEEGRALAVGAEGSPDLPNLLTRVLLGGTATLLRRGLDRSYEPFEAELATVRGHIELGPSLRLQARNMRRLQCEFDELSFDVLHNQIIKAVLKRVAKMPTLSKELASETQTVLARFSGVSDIRLTSSCFSRIRLHRNNAHYDLLLKISQLLHDQLLPTSNIGASGFRDVLANEKEMARVFEAFVRSFYRLEQTTYQVEPLTIRWVAEPVGEDSTHLLPQMRVDVFLKSDMRHLIIDTKYYRSALQEFHGKATLHSGNLYQVFSYLRNHAGVAKDHAQVDGMLLYPAAGHQLNAVFEIHGHTVRVATVDLAQDWTCIHNRLLSLLS